MKDIKIDALSEKISIAKSTSSQSSKAVLTEYFNGWAQIRPFQHTEILEGGLQASITKYMIFIHNRDIPLGHGDTIIWITNNNQRLYVEDYAICSKRDIYRSIRAHTEEG